MYRNPSLKFEFGVASERVQFRVFVVSLVEIVLLGAVVLDCQTIVDDLNKMAQLIFKRVVVMFEGVLELEQLFQVDVLVQQGYVAVTVLDIEKITMFVFGDDVPVELLAEFLAGILQCVLGDDGGSKTLVLLHDSLKTLEIN